MIHQKVVITKTPLRVSFVGGGTDIPYFYKKYSGATASCAIDKYIYVTVKYHNNFGFKYRLNYSLTEQVNSIEEIKNLRIRYVLKFLKIKKPLYINTFSDFPANTGLGSSSSFTVGLLNALTKLINRKLSRRKLAEIAYEIEKKITKDTLGKQDHYISVFGGFKLIRYQKKKITVRDVLKKHKLFFNSLYLVWTKQSRSATTVLSDQKKNKIKNVKYLLELNNLTNKFYKTINNNKIDMVSLGEIINKSWTIKKKLSKFISNKKIDKLYKLISETGIYGAKLLGAGNGGFILILANQSSINKLKKKKIHLFKFLVTENGSSIIS
jgi:D-glycero-alpha-D-manno-heptose-7-phosphate kinase